MSSPRPPTLREIAHAAGVSQMSVSLALRNHPKLPKETCLRIQRVAEEMGYRPDPLLTKLMTHLRTKKAAQQHEVIAWLTLYKGQLATTEPFGRRTFAGATERAEQFGYKLEEFSLSQRGMTGTRLRQILITRRITGLIVAPLREGKRHLSLDWAPFATAAIGYSMLRPNLHRVAPHHFSNMMLLLRRAAKLGYQRIGFVTTKELDRRVNYVWTGALLTFQKQSRKIKPIPMLIEQELNPAKFATWFKKHPLEAIVTDRHDVRNWIVDLGYGVPEDVAVISPGLSGQTLDDAFTGIEELPELLGAAAVDIVTGQLNRNEHGIPVSPKIILLEGKWMDGTTARNIRVQPPVISLR